MSRGLGRPKKYGVKAKAYLQAQILEQLATGKTLRAICLTPGMPPYHAVQRWVQQEEEFAKAYHEARTVQGHYLADECIDIADEDPGLRMAYGKSDKEQICVDSAAIAHQKLRVDTRKWMAAKLAPKTYSDKVDLTTDPDNPPQLTVNVHLVGTANASGHKPS